MDQTEWLTCTNPARMLTYLMFCSVSDAAGTTYPPDNRKLRLFARACNPGENSWEELDQPAPGDHVMSALEAARYCVGLKVRQHHIVRFNAGEGARRANII